MVNRLIEEYELKDQKKEREGTGRTYKPRADFDGRRTRGKVGRSWRRQPLGPAGQKAVTDELSRPAVKLPLGTRLALYEYPISDGDDSLMLLCSEFCHPYSFFTNVICHVA